MIITSIKEVDPTYHDHHLRHYSSSLQQQHTTFSGHCASYQRDRNYNRNYGENILPPKKRVRSSGPDYIKIKAAVAGELVDRHPSSFSSIIDHCLCGRGRGKGWVASRQPLGPWWYIDGWVCCWRPGAVYAGSLEAGMSCFTRGKA